MSSENNWEPSRATHAQCVWKTVPGTDVNLEVLRGDPEFVMIAFAADFNAYVEPLRDADSAAYTETNSVATSNHLNGTAMDLNWRSHPFHVKGTFTSGQMRVIREMQDFYEGHVFWAGDWNDPIDEMHWQMDYDTYRNPAVGDFIRRKIRPDGFSTFRRGSAPPDAAPILARATGITEGKAREILPMVRDGLRASDCTNDLRIAMWLAQVGHESDSFNATEEYEDGDESQERWLYKGRTWIQLTWKSSYAGFSRWCFDRGLVPTPTYFVDHPHDLADLRWAGLGVAYYWTVSRPTLNHLSDAQDIAEVTRLINGGTSWGPPTWLQKRQERYDRALSIRGELVQILNEGDDDMFNDDDRKLVRELHGALFNPIGSQSKYRTAGEGNRWQLHELIKNDDAMLHEMLVERQALMGNPEALGLVKREADKGDDWAQVVYDYAATAGAKPEVAVKAPRKTASKK